MMEEDERETASFQIDTSYAVPDVLQERYISSNELLLKRNEIVILLLFIIFLLRTNFRNGIIHQINQLNYCLREMKL